MSKTPAAKLRENAIRFIGDNTDGGTGVLRRVPDEFHTAIGAADYEHGNRIVKQLESRNLVEIGNPDVGDRVLKSGGGWLARTVLRSVHLTLDGQQEYERYKRESSHGNYGFVALQFSNAKTKELIDAIKPRVSSALGCDLVDMRDVEQPGIIDNIMREKIAGAGFVIADLTDGNRGVYWEAGYAEGLDKPVMYICEKDEFDKEKIHFDTSHCTTISWVADEPTEFCRRLVAALERRLGT